MHKARLLHTLGYCASTSKALRERVKESGTRVRPATVKDEAGRGVVETTPTRAVMT